MNTQEFREFGKAAVDFIADYIDTIEKRPVGPSVEQGYLSKLIPKETPQSGETWEEVLRDVEDVILPGLTHWRSPHFHGYFSAGNSLPSVIGEMMGAGFGCIGLNWLASPVYTELEVAMMNWLGKLLNLPEQFLNSSEGPGGGCLQGSASEATLVALLTAKEKKVKELIGEDDSLTPSEIKGRLVAYSSDQANSSIEKAGLFGSMTMRLLPGDENGRLRGDVLEAVLREDKRRGLIPCYLVANVGTTPTCAFDNLEELGLICAREKIWMHVDAAYAGSAFACPEYRYLMKGIERVDSFVFNPHKWMLVNFDCSAMWLKDTSHLVEAFNVQRVYLKAEHRSCTPEYRHWQIPLGRKFRALKLWFVLRIYGVEGIQKHIRTHVALGEYFRELVESDQRFEVVTCSLGLVCFRLKGDNYLTLELLNQIEKRRRIFVLKGHFRGKHVVRLAICSTLTEKRHVEISWKEIKTVADSMEEKDEKGDKENFLLRWDLR